MEANDTDNKEKKLTKKELRNIFFRTFFIRSTLNFERHQNLGFAVSMTPVIEKFYKDKKEKIKAYQRHMQFFLTNPMMGATVVGVTTAMEEQRSKGRKGVTDESINAVKTALMSPLAALGDSLISGTIRPLVAGVAASLALQGSVLGPILFFAVMSIFSIGIKYIGVFEGYKRGVSFVTDVESSGIIDNLTELASVAALVVIGGFIPNVVELTTPITFSAEDASIVLQEQLDSLMPGLLPLGITLLMYYIIKKTNISAVTLIIILMVIGVVGHYIGIF